MHKSSVRDSLNIINPLKQWTIREIKMFIDRKEQTWAPERGQKVFSLSKVLLDNQWGFHMKIYFDP